MFTGIIEELGTVEAMSGNSLRVAAQKVTEGVALGDSMAVNGVCLTVTESSDRVFSVEVMPETLKRSNIGSLTRGERVNLERALTLSSRIGGHLVQGHVDATGKVVSMTAEGNATLLKLSAPENVTRYLVDKAFIAVDGISLTVAMRQDSTFTLSIVGSTFRTTTIGFSRPGRIVNLEVDIVAKYVELFAKTHSSGITEGLLAEHGFCGSGSDRKSSL